MPKIRRKLFSRKKCALMFSQVGSKESQLNSEQNFGRRQADILKFKRSNVNKQFFD